MYEYTEYRPLRTVRSPSEKRMMRETLLIDRLVSYLRNTLIRSTRTKTVKQRTTSFESIDLHLVPGTDHISFILAFCQFRCFEDPSYLNEDIDHSPSVLYLSVCCLMLNADVSLSNCSIGFFLNDGNPADFMGFTSDQHSKVAGFKANENKPPGNGSRTYKLRKYWPRCCTSF